MSTGHIVISVVFFLLYLAFLLWYGGRGKPLSQAEVENLLTEMIHRAGKQAQTEKSPILDQFRELTKNDDGRDYYMVNLMKFRQKALYPEGSSLGDDPMAANDRYNRAIVPLLLKHGGHPVFLGQVQGRFLHPGGADDWDQVGIVRYRSQRDMLKMAIEVAGLGVDIHKWAALEKTQVVFGLSPSAVLYFRKPSTALSRVKPRELRFIENLLRKLEVEPAFFGLTKNQSLADSGSWFIAGLGFEPRTSGL